MDTTDGNANEFREAFRRHYEDDSSHWGKGSGAGSNAYFTIEYRHFLEKFLVMNGISSVVDIGCGDWQFSRFLNWANARYLGLDVVPSVIQANQKRFGLPSVQFRIMPENLAEVPSGDLLIMKDVLQHLPEENILRFRDLVLPKFKYCLITNSYQKLETPVNVDIRIGDFRCLDLQAAPFQFRGAYVLEFASPLWERIRTFLCTP
jgi:SAM-dependent methyltransferase